ncbi:A-kinase anchoring protein 7 isoform X2 [Bufo gargarizans]|uniref:A-kinase anchoring protein 7 isoform X2 n=1 Tax=Bufo gargarizans TaxID=30331 RepID=UPI001CF2F4BC|nr:A-kinase anchoring protein 7 isoform X2 [Bufo gargarizans]
MWASRRALYSLVNIALHVPSRRCRSDVFRGTSLNHRVTFRAPRPMEYGPLSALPVPGERGSERVGEAACENEAAEKNQQKRTTPHKKNPGSAKSLLTELPFAGADISYVFETKGTLDKKVKKKRKRHQLESDEDDGKSKKQKRANYFVSLPITNVKILDDIHMIQNSVLKKDDRLSKAMIPQGSFHLTLFVMHLASEEEVTVATSALLDSKKPIEEILQRNVLVLSFSGISDFKHEVVYVNLTDEASVAALKQITEATGKIFMEKGISVTGCKDFVPHLTFMKLSRAPKLRKQGMKKIDAHLYKDFQDHCFGEETLTRLDLCSMLKKKQPSGYYHTEASILFGHKNGREPDEAELLSLSKKLVENAVLKAVQQYIEETQTKTKQTDGILVEPGNNEKTENNIK